MPRLRKLAGRNARRRRGGGALLTNFITTASGGGSGEIYTKNYKRGDVISVTIGVGGSYSRKTSGVTSGGAGGTTIFGDLILYGGEGGYASGTTGSHGAAVGSIATAGSDNAGGYGNKNNTSQTYGNGGASRVSGVENGKSGAVILTYLGR